jgi:hypothetical protein
MTAQPAPVAPQATTLTGNAPFLDAKKQVPSRREWNRDVISRQGGTISFRLTSQGPFSVLVLTDRGRKALLGGGQLLKEDGLFNIDAPGPVFEGKVTVPPGPSWFIIENQASQAVEMHLECFEARKDAPLLDRSALPPVVPAGAAVDLLALLNPEQDQLQGQWRREGGALISPATDAAMIQVPYAPGQDYRLTLVAEPATVARGLNLGIVVGGHEVMVALEGWDKRANGLNLVDGKTADDNETTNIAAVFDAGRPTTIVCIVRKTAVQITSNGQPLIQWSGDPARLSLDQRFWPHSAPGKLFLASWESSYRISKLELVPLAP